MDTIEMKDWIMNQEQIGPDGANVSNSVEASQGVRHKSTAPIPSIHALYATEMALRQSWQDDTTKYQHTAPHTSRRTLQAWYKWLSAWWTEESEAR